MFHRTNSIAPTHQRSYLHLSLSPPSLFFSRYLFPSCLSTHLFPSFPPLPSSSFDHSLLPSLSPLHSFLSSPLLSSHLTLSLSSMWVVTTENYHELEHLEPCSQSVETSEIFLRWTPSGWTGCHHRPTSALAVPFDAHSLHPGATLHFAQSRNEYVRIFWVDRLRPLTTGN